MTLGTLAWSAILAAAGLLALGAILHDKMITIDNANVAQVIVRAAHDQRRISDKERYQTAIRQIKAKGTATSPR